MSDMFDGLMREVRRLEDMRVPISLPLDDDGYLDRKCPSLRCRADFKICFQDLESSVGSGPMHCPLCGKAAPTDEWNTAEQTEQIERQALHRFQEAVNEAMARAAKRSRGWTFEPGHPPIMLPFVVTDAMQQKYTCEKCRCRYAAVGAAFFCPACGHNSASTTFDLAVGSVRKTIEHLPSIRQALIEASGRDVAQNTLRDIVEEQMGKLVGSFQRFAEALFVQLPKSSAIKTRKNVFQRLNDSNDLWRVACGRGYEDVLSAGEFGDLIRLFQQRHLLAHRDGMVDQEYIDKSGDKSYCVGQRLVIQEASVLRLADLVVKLAAEIRTWVAAAGMK